MKNILCIIQLPPPVHGVSECNKILVNSDLINSNYKLSIINLQFSKSISDIEHFSFKKILTAIKYCFKIVKEIKLSKPDLIYFTISPNGSSFYRDAFYVLLIKIFRKKILFHLHGQGFKDSTKQNLVKKRISKFIFNNAEVICLAKKLTTDIKEVFSGKPFIVHNGIKIQDNIIKRKPKDNKIVQLLYLSHLKENKGVMVFMEALKILKENGEVFQARLVGESGGLTIEYLQNYIQENSLQNHIQLVGPLYEMKKFVEFNNADIFVFPTYFDAFPLVILEAMQCELPIITTDEGGIPEIVIDGVTGFIIEKKNITQLVEKITFLINEPNIRKNLGFNGRKRFLKYFTLLHFENNVKSVFDTLLK